MAAIAVEIDHEVSEQKLLRAAHRARSLHKDRMEYARHLDKSSQLQTEDGNGSMPAAYRHAHPHRAARAVARSWLAKGGISGETDMPTISTGHADLHKPSPSSRLCAHIEVSSKTQSEMAGFDSDADTTVPLGADVAEEPLSETTSPAMSFTADPQLAKDMCQSELGEPARTDEPNTGESHDLLSILLFRADAEHGSLQHSVDEPETKQLMQDKADLDVHSMNSNPESSVIAKRETILRGVIATLRNQARDAAKEAEEAKAHAQEVEQKEAMQHQREKASARKQALQMERQRAAKLRKQRNQATNLEAVKAKADRTLQEAAAIREQAQDEALLVRAQLLAEASQEAQQQAEAQRQGMLVAAKAEAEALKSEGWEAAMEAQRTKAEVEAEADALRMLVDREKVAAAEVKVQAEAMYADAERDAQIIRESALEDVVALKTRVLEQLREKAEFEKTTRREAAEKLAREATQLAEREAAEAQRQARIIAQREAAAALKSAKLMEQARARKIHKQARHERRQEQMKNAELEAIKAQAEQDVRLIKEQALSEVAAMKAKAKMDTKDARIRAIAAARKDAQEKAQADAAKLTAEAELVAETIKAKAMRDVDELMRQVAAVEDTAVAQADAAEVEDLQAEAEEEEDWEVVSEEVEDSDEDWGLLIA